MKRITTAEALSRDQVLAVLKAARAVSERDFLMILVAYSHAMRASEVCQLRPEHISGGYITVCRLKGSKTTAHPLVEDENPLLDEKTSLTEWIKSVKPRALLFPIGRRHFWTRFKEHARTAGVPAHVQRVHNLKHSACVGLVPYVSLPELQRFTGHVSLSSLGRYLEPSQQQVDNAVAAARRAMSAV